VPYTKGTGVALDMEFPTKKRQAQPRQNRSGRPEGNLWIFHARRALYAVLYSTSLGYKVGYEKMAEMCSGKGFLVRNTAELERATIVNVIIESGRANKLVSGYWIDS